MKQYIYIPYSNAYKITYSTNQIGANERLFINEIKNEANGVQTVGLPSAAVALGFPDEFVEITKTTLEALATTTNHTLLVMGNDSGSSRKHTSQNSAAEILTFSLAAETGAAVIDSAAATISIEVAFGTVLTALAATFTTSVDITSIKIGATAQVSASTTNNFSTPKTYRVIAEHGEIKDWVVTVAVAAE